MLTFTRKTGYALIALTHLARGSGGCSSAGQIATRYQMSRPLLMNVLKRLAKRKLVRSVRGPQGGYSLVSSPSQITLKEIIQAVEGPIYLARCLAQRDGKRSQDLVRACPRVSGCPVRSSIHRVHDQLVQFLDEVTLTDIADPSAGFPRDAGHSRQANRQGRKQDRA